MLQSKPYMKTTKIRTLNLDLLDIMFIEKVIKHYKFIHGCTGQVLIIIIDMIFFNTTEFYNIHG